jgi:hypothetical protein
MNRILSKYIDKLFFKKWIIGIFQGNIEDIIRSKTFDPDINWLLIKSFDKFYADPFLLRSKDGNSKILFEEYAFDDDYAKISLMTLDKSLRQANHKILLDTKSHLSYPFVFTENNKTYVFPEAAQSGKLSCYEYDPVHESLNFVQDLLNLPLRDSTILKHDSKYWIYGTLSENSSNYKLCVFFSDSLLGPYFTHPGNPIKSGLNGTRSAGNFIEVDGIIYRPTQNCKNNYGESITINKITELNEIHVNEEPYMNICINKKNRCNYGMHLIHTINVMDNIIVVDGEHWTFSPIHQFRKFSISILKSYRLRKKKAFNKA